ncbi:MAG: GAF domain-containing sensor histidine kinase, partial [Rubrobacter sp.]|nr:GAF domain-containing sensor histidine kinase [Rubrobacter sp.]
SLAPDAMPFLGGIVLAAPWLAIGVAILRHNLYDIDFIINRTLVYGGLTACVVGIYVFVVGYLGTLFRAEENLAISLVATGIVAVAFQPLRDRLQRAVNRLMYGERDEPYEVLSRLGERLEGTLDPDSALSTIVDTVVQAMNIPHAAIALDLNGESVKAAEHGEPKGTPTTLPLSYGGRAVGRLVLSPRSPGEEFSASDRRLLEDLARQAGAAVHAVRLTADLKRSREGIVTAREEERRRLRRDLHDGLGPRLAAQTLKVGSAKSLFPRDPETANMLLEELERDLDGALADIRRLVYNLRPPALDQLGLEGAIRESASQYDSEKMGVAFRGPENVRSLPAAVEVAAYRISQEALANAARHASAKNCAVRLSMTSDILELEISDDGVGVPDDRRIGVGLSSMRERAEELGGTCGVEAAPGGGTRVFAKIPLPEGETE